MAAQLNRPNPRGKRNCGGGGRVLAAVVCLLFSAGTVAADLTCGGEKLIELRGEQAVVVTLASPPKNSRLIVEERGADLAVEVGSATTPVLLSYPMTRYAWREFPAPDTGALTLRVKLWRATHGSALLRLDCSPVEPQRRTWLGRAQERADEIDRSVQARPQIAAYAALVADAHLDRDRASALHLYAGALFQVDRYADSVAAYRQAHQAWAKLGERTRAGAALLGVADLEMRLERHAEGAATAAQIPKWLDPKGDAYLRVRARQVGCSHLEKQGQAKLAADCTEGLIGAYRKAGDAEGALQSAVSMLISLRNTPDRARTARLLRMVEKDPTFASAPPVLRGSFFFIRAYVQREQGNLPEALADFERAMDSFEAGTEERLRWQANVMVQVAGIYGQLGMTEQAYRLLERALLLYQPASSPGRVASALMALASVERANEREPAAARWFERARSIYELLKMPTEGAEAELGMLELRLPATPAAAAKELDLVRDWSGLSNAHRGRLQLLEVRWMIAAQRYKEARQRLRALNLQALSLPQSLLAARLGAQLLAMQGRPAEALAQLEKALTALTVIARQTQNGGLGYLVLRSGRELREAWVGVALDAPLRPELGSWWQTLVGSSPLQAVAPNGSADAADPAFSAAVSRELLGSGQSITGESERALLSALASDHAADAVDPRSTLPALANVQSALGEAWLLVIVPAEPASVAIWISSRQGSIVSLPGRADLKKSIGKLLLALHAADAPTAGIHAASLTLSSQLLQDAPLAAAPASILVLSDDLLGTIPLGLLRWPGSDRALIETTTSSWITRFEVAAKGVKAPAVSRLHAVIAPGTASTARVGLAPLRYAEREAELIALADPKLEILRHVGGDATRAELVSALREPQAWVHLAAHGFARPQLLGYAGTWLASAGDPTRSEFLSWLDVANTPLAAPLAVLNACQLAAGPSATSQSSLSFAVAVSAAGIDHVVAAFWPISDSASALWIPVFYRAMRGQDAAHSSAALREAQLALKNSRAYRHPYYWASLAHFRRMPIP